MPTLAPPPPDDKILAQWSRWFQQLWDTARGVADLSASLGTVANTLGAQTLQNKTLTSPVLTTPTITVAAWTAPTFTNSWVNFDATTYNAAGYYKDGTGRVWLRGLIKSGVLGSAAFTLPVGSRPLKHHIVATLANGGADALGRLDINTDGTVIPTSGGNSYFTLDGISFLTT